MPAQSVLEQLADAVICADRSGNIVLWNPAATAMFGYSAAEALGHPLSLIIPEYLRSAHWRAYESAMAAGVMRFQGRPTVMRAKHFSGRKLYVDVTFAIVIGEGGVAQGAVAVARDVTERIDQERANTHLERDDGILCRG